MEFKHCIVQKNRSAPMVVKCSKTEKPEYEFMYYESNPEAEYMLNLKLQQWQKTFKEYPVKDEKAFKDLIILQWQQGVVKYPHRSNYETEIKKGIPIESTKVCIEEFDCEPNCGYGCCHVCQEPTEYAILK